MSFPTAIATVVACLIFPAAAQAAPLPVVLSNGPDNHAQWGQLTAQGVTAIRYQPGVALPTNHDIRPWSLSTIADEQAFAADAKTNGLGVWIQAGNLAYADDIPLVRAAFSAFAQQSNVIGVHGVDEPIHWKLTPTPFVAAHVAARAVAPKIPWVTINPACGVADICPASFVPRLRSFNEISEAQGVDHFPVTLRANGVYALHNVGKDVARLRAASHLPTWVSLGICYSGARPKGATTYVAPSAYQNRFMATDALINGAIAFSYFGGNLKKCMSSADRAAGFNWTEYNAAVVPTDRYLSTVRPYIGKTLRAVKHGAGIEAARRGALILTCRPFVSALKHKVNLYLPKGRYRVLDTGAVKTVRKRGGHIAVSFRGWQTHSLRAL